MLEFYIVLVCSVIPLLVNGYVILNISTKITLIKYSKIYMLRNLPLSDQIYITL